MNVLRLVLSANGLFSACSGLLLLGWPNWIQSNVVSFPLVLLQFIGIGLFAFGCLALMVATAEARTRYQRVVLISMLDFGWVLVTTLLALSGLVQAKAAVLLTSAIVASFGIGQLWATDRLLRQGSGHRRICFRFKIQSSAQQFWQRLERLENIKNYIPDLAQSKLVKGTHLAVGTVRECVDVAGQRWQEECVQVGERSFVLKFVTEAPDYPYPLQDMHGGWEVEDTPSGAEVSVWWTARGKSAIPEWILFPLMAAKAERATPTIIYHLDLRETNTASTVRKAYVGRFC